MGIKFIKVSVVYFVIGVLLGMYMSIVHDYALTGVHAHVNLLGWASFALSGVIYCLFPEAGRSMLAKIHFWLHNIGLPLMMIGLTLLLSGMPSFEVLIPIGATLVVLSVLLFAVNALKNIRAKEA